MLRFIFYFLLSSPLWYWFYRAWAGSLGVEPLETLNVETGYVTLTLFLVNLWLGVAIRFLKARVSFLKWWFQRRRSLGVATGIYAIMHFSTYLGQESFAPQAWEQLLTKLYLTVAFLALLILLTMTLTSNNWSLRKLKFHPWKILHRAVHVASLLILTHVMLIEKGNIPLLVAMTLPIVPFQLWRLIKFCFSWKNRIRTKSA